MKKILLCSVFVVATSTAAYCSEIDNGGSASLPKISIITDDSPAKVPAPPSKSGLNSKDLDDFYGGKKRKGKNTGDRKSVV